MLTKMHLYNRIDRLKSGIIHLLYPPRCLGCDDILSLDEKYYCKTCQETSHLINGNRCEKCGRPSSPYERLCSQCQEKNFKFERGIGLLAYEGNVHSTMYRLKYGNRRDVGELLGQLLYLERGDIIRKWSIDAIVPIPLHKKRYKMRGYNQADVIGEGLAKLSDIPLRPELLQRIKETKPQSGLSGLGRKNNLKDAFITPYSRKDTGIRRVLLVDDIYTSGSTMDYCAEVLLGAGIEKVYFAVAAIAI